MDTYQKYIASFPTDVLDIKELRHGTRSHQIVLSS